MAAVSVATSAARSCVFAPVVASAAGASALFDASSLHQPSLATAAGVPALASAGASGDPVLVSRVGLPAAADISGPGARSLCLEQWGAPQVEGR